MRDLDKLFDENIEFFNRLYKRISNFNKKELSELTKDLNEEGKRFVHNALELTNSIPFAIRLFFSDQKLHSKIRALYKNHPEATLHLSRVLKEDLVKDERLEKITLDLDGQSKTLLLTYKESHPIIDFLNDALSKWKKGEKTNLLEGTVRRIAKNDKPAGKKPLPIPERSAYKTQNYTYVYGDLSFRSLCKLIDEEVCAALQGQSPMHYIERIIKDAYDSDPDHDSWHKLLALMEMCWEHSVYKGLFSSDANDPEKGTKHRKDIKAMQRIYEEMRIDSPAHFCWDENESKQLTLGGKNMQRSRKANRSDWKDPSSNHNHNDLHSRLDHLEGRINQLEDAQRAAQNPNTILEFMEQMSNGWMAENNCYRGMTRRLRKEKTANGQSLQEIHFSQNDQSMRIYHDLPTMYAYNGLSFLTLCQDIDSHVSSDLFSTLTPDVYLDKILNDAADRKSPTSSDSYKRLICIMNMCWEYAIYKGFYSRDALKTKGAVHRADLVTMQGLFISAGLEVPTHINWETWRDCA